MGATVTASNGVQLPVDSLAVTITYSGSLVLTKTVVYSGIVYVQTYSNDGTNITAISQWVAQIPPVLTYMETQSGGYLMVTQDNKFMITELS